MNNDNIYYPELMPWEPLITGFRDYATQNCQPDPGDICEHCRKTIDELSVIVTIGGSQFCSWECLIAHARKWPQFYTIQHTGAYDV